jgi:hypothetical protein
MNSKQPVKLTEAAKRLGITRQAAHLRVQRGQLDAYQDEQGHWWVPWPPDDLGEAELVAEQLPAVASELTVSLTQFVEGLSQLSQVIEQQEATIRELQGTVKELTAELRAQHERQPSRDEWIVARMREMVDEKPECTWWKFWQD